MGRVLCCCAVRVAFVLDRFPVASELFIVEQIAGLLDLDVDVEIFAGKPASPVVAHDKIERYRLLSRTHYGERSRNARGWAQVAARAAGSPLLRRRLMSLALHSFTGLRSRSPVPMLCGMAVLERPRFDVVHAHFGHFAQLVAPLRASGYAAPLVATFHGYDANVEPRRSGSDMYRYLFRVGDLFTVNSRFLEQRLHALGCDPARIRLLPMPVDLEQLEFEEKKLADGEPVRLLSVARLVEAKGIETAIRAVARLADKGYKVDYRIVGDGELRSSLASVIGELGLRNRVQLLGAQPHQEVRRLYRESHVFVLPSVRSARGDEETQGVVVQEAQAAGLPVIVSDVGGVREGIVENESGVVFHAGDVDDLAKAVEELVARPSTWARMGRAGREFVCARYTQRAHCRRLLELYEAAIHEDRL